MLYIEPQAGSAPVVHVIDAARREVHLDVYYLSSRKVLSALRAAHGRGVAVSVILDEHPYGMKPWQVHKEYEKARAAGATVRWAPRRFEAVNGRFVYTHAKYVCNGHECEIGSANFDWSAFHRNREYLYVTRNPQVVRAANAVFTADWENRRAGPGPRQMLVLSPGSQELWCASSRNQGRWISNPRKWATTPSSCTLSPRKDGWPGLFCPPAFPGRISATCVR